MQKSLIPFFLFLIIFIACKDDKANGDQELYQCDIPELGLRFQFPKNVNVEVNTYSDTQIKFECRFSENYITVEMPSCDVIILIRSPDKVINGEKNFITIKKELNNRKTSINIPFPHYIYKYIKRENSQIGLTFTRGATMSEPLFQFSIMFIKDNYFINFLTYFNFNDETQYERNILKLFSMEDEFDERYPDSSFEDYLEYLKKNENGDVPQEVIDYINAFEIIANSIELYE